MLSKLNRKDERGFTLIELMIVIAIIGILAAIAIPQFSAYRQRSYNSAAQSDLRNLATAEEAYFVDASTYPASAIPTLRDVKYGFAQSGKVIIGGSGSTTAYTISSYHTAGNKTYTLTGPGGTIQ